eukprot:c26143_g1_i1 orf=123-293(-)
MYDSHLNKNLDFSLLLLNYDQSNKKELQESFFSNFSSFPLPRTESNHYGLVKAGQK